jgi:HD-GYP domain-containing protein (c-di-GMP phosphodiesterase class II)
MAERIALYHHERWDGKGYNGLAGENIPVEARIVSIPDVYDVVTHERPYKEAQSPATALALLQEESGKQFDPNLVQVMLDLNIPFDLAVLNEALENEPAPVRVVCLAWSFPTKANRSSLAAGSPAPESANWPTAPPGERGG